MIKRFIKSLALLVAVAVLVIPAIALLVDDETLSSALEGLPIAGDYSEAILKQKQGISITLAEHVGDAFNNLETLYFDVLGFSAPRPATKVVIDLPLPPPRTATPARAVAPPPPPPAGGLTPSPPPSPVSAPKQVVHKTPPRMTRADRPKAAAKPAAPRKVARLPAAKKKKRPVKKDPTADQDHKRGLLFYKGIGVDKDFKKAGQWFRRAANKGHAGAQYLLGIMSYLGQGMEQDFAKAALWFQRAGEQDHAAAQYNLGFLYYEGKGVEKDNLQAFMWIDRSANLGDEKAIRARDTLQKALPREIFN